MSSLPPRHLCIAGALCIALGVGSVTEMTAALLGGRISIELGFVGIPIGYGILIGRASSRKWALFFAHLALLLTVVCVGWAGYDRWTGGGRMPPYPDSVAGGVVLVLVAASSFYVRSALTRSGQEEWFLAEKQETSAAKTLTWAVVAVAAFLHASEQTTEWWMQKTLAQVHPVHVRVAPYNAENGQGMKTLDLSGEVVNPTKQSVSKLPRLTSKTFGGDDGIQVAFDGVAAAPFQITLRADGFEDKTITLDRESQKVIRVPMQPLDAGQKKTEPGKAEPKADAAPATTRADSD